MKAEDSALAITLKQQLQNYSETEIPLPGIQDDAAMNTFIFQIIESIRRIRFIKQVGLRPISPLREDPKSDLFDPIRAAILKRDAGYIDEAFWLVFLFTHFGKNLRSEYQLIRDVYGRVGQNGMWDWLAVSSDPLAFRHWLDNKISSFKVDGVHRGFGNHRKYQSLHAWNANGTGAAIQSYVEWIKASGGHSQLFDGAILQAGGDPETAFKLLYRNMDSVRSFGRTAKFDYLSMVGKLELARIRPNSVYFQAATGPVVGAKLLFRGNSTARFPASQLQDLADNLASQIGLDKQAMEDSLCNWQKSPNEIRRFRG
jgi:hypothetical protein